MKKPLIIPTSYELKNGKYVPSVILRFIDGPTIRERPLTWRKQFDTKEEADRYALSQAELYIKKINETIVKFSPKEIKEKAKRFDFYIRNFEGLGYDVVGEIKVGKDNFNKKIEEKIKEEQIRKIKENVSDYFLRLSEDKREGLLKLPSEKTRTYVVDSVSGTTAVVPFAPLNFLDKGGVVYPDYDEFLRTAKEIPDITERVYQPINIINIKGNNNVVNPFIIEGKRTQGLKEKWHQKWWVKIVIRVIIGLTVVLLAYYFFGIK